MLTLLWLMSMILCLTVLLLQQLRAARQHLFHMAVGDQMRAQWDKNSVSKYALDCCRHIDCQSLKLGPPD